MRVLSIAACLSIAASLAACDEEPQTVFPPDAGRDAGPAPVDAGTRGDAGATGNPAALGGIDAGAAPAAPAAKLPVQSDGEWVVFAQDGGVANIAEEITGGVIAEEIKGGGMEVTLEVENLPAARKFGTHLHQLSCREQQGGPHYQHVPAPAGAATDPKFANEENELWLDFETDPEGKGSRTAKVDWVPRRGGANSIVVHERITAEGGIAGARLACTDLPFVD